MRDLFERYKFYLFAASLLLLLWLVVVLLGSFPVADPPASPIVAQAVADYDSLTGEMVWGEQTIYWDAQALSPTQVISGMAAVDCDDVGTGISPVALWGSNVSVDVYLDLELRGDQVYTQAVGIDKVLPEGECAGNFWNPQWVWLDIVPGKYSEYIRLRFEVAGQDIFIIENDELVPLDEPTIYGTFVDDGAVVEQDERYFSLYREIETAYVIYLPVVLKRR